MYCKYASVCFTVFSFVKYQGTVVYVVLFSSQETMVALIGDTNVTQTDDLSFNQW